MKFFLFLFVFVVSSCSIASTEKFEWMLNTWVGQPETKLVEQWGAPDQVYENDGKRYLSYIYSDISSTRPRVHSSIVGNQILTNTYGGNVTQEYCKATFIVENKNVIGWQYKGDDCLWN